ncbi:MAG: phosphoenolpyruvate mutase [Parachlamydiales bacterium]|nr:phosphoenolpyruvate mutase [Parachlamydiales bacterium]
MDRAKLLRQLLDSMKVEYVMEAHNGISAKIAQNAGFKALWASGLTISSSLGHRDCNEISWTNVCDQVEYMVDATTIPIILDGDTGFGNFNNVRQLIIKLCKYQVAGVSLEDKTFPKINSFKDGKQQLASIDEFCGKIKAAKDTQTNESFCVFARTEAFILNHGLEEALKRAYAYKEAGADGIIVHSKKQTIEEIELFCSKWDYSIPLIIIPTKFDLTPFEVYSRLKLSLVIWANHLLRASMIAMKNTAKELFNNKCAKSIKNEIATIEDIFELVNEKEWKEAEKKYLLNNV